jgi:transcriptional regulator with XRE-family HTH domain
MPPLRDFQAISLHGCATMSIISYITMSEKLDIGRCLGHIPEAVRNVPRWAIDLGQELARLREGAGARQEDVAERIGKTRQTVINYEKGEQVPTLKILAQICEFLGSTTFVIDGQRFDIRIDNAAQKPRIVPKQLRLKLGITCSTEQAKISSTRKGNRIEVEILSA